jgi:hypothetical protein
MGPTPALLKYLQSRVLDTDKEKGAAHSYDHNTLLMLFLLHWNDMSMPTTDSQLLGILYSSSPILCEKHFFEFRPV